MKKQSDLSRLMGYAGNYRYFTYASWVLSAVSALVALVPFVYIWKILRDVLNAARSSISPHMQDVPLGKNGGKTGRMFLSSMMT